MFSYITGESNKIGFGMLPGVADFPSAHLKRRCLIVQSEQTQTVLKYAEPDKKTKQPSISMIMDFKSPSRVRKNKSTSDRSSFRDEMPRDWWSVLQRVTSRTGAILTREEERCKR